MPPRRCKGCTYYVTENKAICYECNSYFHEDCARKFAARKSRAYCCTRVFQTLIQTRPLVTVGRGHQFVAPSLNRLSHQMSPSPSSTLRRSFSNPTLNQFENTFESINTTMSPATTSNNSSANTHSPNNNSLPENWESLNTDQRLEYIARNQNSKFEQVFRRMDNYDTQIQQLRAENEASRKSQAGALSSAHEMVISGFPKNTALDYKQIMATLLEILNLSDFITDIISFRDFKKRSNPTNVNVEADNTETSGSFIVKFKSISVRDSILEAKIKHGNITLGDVFGPTIPNPTNCVFINQMLSPFTHSLFLRAKAVKKSLSYAYCWVRDGQIYMRKTKESSAIIINSELDLVNLK